MRDEVGAAGLEGFLHDRRRREVVVAEVHQARRHLRQLARDHAAGTEREGAFGVRDGLAAHREGAGADHGQVHRTFDRLLLQRPREMHQAVERQAAVARGTVHRAGDRFQRPQVHDALRDAAFAFERLQQRREMRLVGR